MQPTTVLDLGAIKEAVQELYGLGLKKITSPDFYKPYLEMTDRENPYPRGHMILDFSLISPYSLEKVVNPPWNILLDSLYNVRS